MQFLFIFFFAFSYLNVQKTQSVFTTSVLTVNGVSQNNDQFNYNTASQENQNIEWTCEQLDSCNDKLAFEAIKSLHRQLDDDHNGNVDMTESADFLKRDLNHTDANEKQSKFHGNDKHISVEDLWLYWIKSEVHNWTVDQAIEWLYSCVELGQYENFFRINQVNGSLFPRLASSQTFLTNTLGIKDPIHKQKVALKAMDLVLFGAPKMHNYFKDFILVFSILVAMLGCCFAALQRKNSQNHLRKMLKDLEALQKAEEQLENLQHELHQAKQKQEAFKTEKIKLEENLLKEGNYSQLILRDSSLPNVGEINRIFELEEELRNTKQNLHRVEEAMSKQQWAPPQKLQYWLQLTHELELKNHNAKRQAAELQLLSAKEGCEKLRKKRSSFLGSFRVAHGSSIDDVDNRILQAKESLAEITKDLQERLYRWKQIERLCNFTIQQNRGEHFLQTELYKHLICGNQKNGLNNFQRTGSEGTLLESEDSFGFSTVNLLFDQSLALLMTPGLDSSLHNYLPLNCLKNKDNNTLKSLNLKQKNLKKFLKRRYSEILIRNFSPFTSSIADSTSNSFCSNANISNVHYRVNPVLNVDKLSKHLSQIKNINLFENKKSNSNSLFDEDNSSEEIEKKPTFILGEISNKKQVPKINNKILSQTNNENDNLKEEPQSELISHAYHTQNTLESDYINNLNENSKFNNSTDTLDLSKAEKKRKSYKIFSVLRKRNSKFSSQESH